MPADGAEGVARALAFLDRMDDATRESKIGTGARLRWAGALGDLLSKHAKDPDAAKSLYVTHIPFKKAGTYAVMAVANSSPQ